MEGADLKTDVVTKCETLFDYAMAVLQTHDTVTKCELTFEAKKRFDAGELPIGDQKTAPIPPTRPARPLNLTTVAPQGVQQKLKDAKANAIRLVHTQAHIESYAVDLSWDILLRFARPEPIPTTESKEGVSKDYDPDTLLDIYLKEQRQRASSKLPTTTSASSKSESSSSTPTAASTPVTNAKPNGGVDAKPKEPATEPSSSTPSSISSSMPTSASLSSSTEPEYTTPLFPEHYTTHLPPGEQLPPEYFAHWLCVAEDEARHFLTWNKRLGELGSHYGAFNVHDSLWNSAETTSNDLLARLAIVHCVHEAHGLDCGARLIATLSTFIVSPSNAFPI